MKELKVLSEDKLDFLHEKESKIAEMYLMVENRCQKDIGLDDAVYFAEKVCELLKDTEVLKTYNSHLEEENNLLRELVVQKDLELHKLKCD